MRVLVSVWLREITGGEFRCERCDRRNLANPARFKIRFSYGLENFCRILRGTESLKTAPVFQHMENPGKNPEITYVGTMITLRGKISGPNLGKQPISLHFSQLEGAFSAPSPEALL